MKKTIFILSVLLISVSACKKPANCDTTVEQGESVFLPVEFVGFAPQEIDQIRVYRINNVTPGDNDTFTLNKVLWAFSAHSDFEHITDRALNGSTDPYYSYFHNCTLIFDWQTKRDTLVNFEILKHKGSTSDKCHKDDPIVILDKVSYTYKGKVIPRDSGIVIYK